MSPSKTVDPATDLRERWLPSDEQRAAGVAAINTVDADRRDRFVAVVALVQPGKIYGFWETGQQVVCLPGVWLAENTSEDTAHSYSKATEAAEQVGRRWLVERGLVGTVATAVVRPDGEAAVFESLIDANGA